MPEIYNNFCGVFRTYYYEQKKLKSEVFMNNGKREGVYKSYWENGQLWEEVNYINDKMNGIYKSYWHNGKLKIEVNYIDGKKI